METEVTAFILISRIEHTLLTIPQLYFSFYRDNEIPQSVISKKNYSGKYVPIVTYLDLYSIQYQTYLGCEHIAI